MRLYITQTPRQKRIEVASKNQENIAAKVRQGDKISLLFFTLPNSVCGPSVHPFIHPSLSCENLMMMEVTHSLHRNQWSTAYIFPPSLQGGPSARGIQFVNIIITVPPQYELPILKSNFYFNVNKRLYPTRWTTL